MMTKLQTRICKKIADHYGYKKQEIQAIQELSELTCLLARRPDQRMNMDFRSEVLQEMADVSIMMEQLRIMLEITEDEMDDAICKKLDRQMHRIDENENLVIVPAATHVQQHDC